MRLLIDTNLFVSHFLNLENRATTIGEVLSMAFNESNVLLLPFAQIVELVGIANKPKLRERMPVARWQAFLELLEGSSTVLPNDPRPFPSSVRDHKDDYLIAVALWENVDVLISGDKDLLALSGHLDRPRIMSPAAFVSEFGGASD